MKDSFSIFRLLSSVLRLPSSVFRPLSSVFRLLSSVFRPLSSVFHLPSSVFRPLSSLLCLLASLAAGAADLNRFQYSRDVKAVGDREEIAAILLDNVMWDHLQNGATDLRITDGRGLDVPFILQKASRKEMQTERIACKSAIKGFKQISEDQAEVMLALNTNTPYAHEIVFSTPLRDYEKKISVWGIRPDGASERLVEDALIYDYSRFADVRHNTVDLPENTFRNFKVLVDAVLDKTQSPQSQITRTFEGAREVRVTDSSTVTTRAFRMDSVIFNHKRTVEKRSIPRKTVHAPKNWNIEQDGKNKSTIVEIETHNEPLHSLELVAAEKNFSRTAVVKIPFMENGRERWREIGRGPVSQISFRTFNRRELAVPFSECQSRRYRVVVANLDGPPLTITAVQCHGPVWRAVFLAAPGLACTVRYGAPGLKPASYDTDHIRRVLDKDFDPVEFALGEVVQNPAFKTGGNDWSAFFSSKAFFIIVVVIMVAVLGLGLIRAGKTVGNIKE